MCASHHHRTLAFVAVWAAAVAIAGSRADASIAAVGNAAAHDPWLLEAGGALSGHGAIDGHFINQGAVIGDGSDESARIVFSPGWTVSGRGAFENTLILGAFAPGNSPAIIQGCNQGFGGTVEIELGGLLPGFGPDNHDQINDAGTIWLVPGVTLSILPWNDFVPSLGDRFVIMTWQEGLDGMFSNVVIDPFFSSRGLDFALTYYNVDGAGSLVLTVVPEPLSIAIWSLFVVACVVGVMRHSTRLPSG